MNSINNKFYDYYAPSSEEVIEFFDYTCVSNHIISTYRQPEWKCTQIEDIRREITLPLVVDLNRDSVVRYY
jgi:hypothetical protein